MDEVERLAVLIQEKNAAERKIAALIGRPATPGNIGEFVAAKVFGISLMTSGSHPGYDGVFQRAAGREDCQRQDLQPTRVGSRY